MLEDNMLYMVVRVNEGGPVRLLRDRLTKLEAEAFVRSFAVDEAGRPRREHKGHYEIHSYATPAERATLIARYHINE